jgi:PAS domain S-box-containing protein
MATPLRVLIVEDRAADAALMADELERAGFAAHWERVETESDFLQQISATPDVILADYTLPQFSALRVLELLQQHGHDIPCIIVSGSIGEDAAVEAMRRGATDYLLKDRLGRLAAAVANAIETRRLRQGRRRVEQSLRSQQRRTELILDTANDAFIEIDAESRIISWNKQAERVFLWPREQAIGRTLHETILPAAHHEAHRRGMAAFLATGVRPVLNKHIEMTARRRDGLEIPIELVIWPIHLDGRYTFAAFARDISDVKKTEAVLAERARLATLQEVVGLSLTRSESLRQMLSVCADALVRHLDAAFARIWTLNTHENVLELQASAGLYTHLDGPHGRVPVGQYKIGRIAAQRQPHLTNDVLNDPHVSNPEWARREGMVAFAGHPLVLESELLGVMAVFARQPLSEFCLQALASVASSIALGIRHKQAADKLLESEAKYRSIFDNAAEGIFQSTIDGRYITVNPAMARILGYESPAELMALVSDIGAQIYADPARRKELRRLLDLHGEVNGFEVELLRKDGSKVWISQNVRAIRNGSGQVAYYQGMSEDITARKRAEAELGKLSRIVEQTADAVLITDRAGNIEYVNPAFESLTGYTWAEVHGKTPALLKSGAHAGTFYTALWATILSGRVFRCVMTNRKKDGTHYHAEKTITPIRDAGGCITHFVSTDKDITERRQAENALRDAQQRLEHVLASSPAVIYVLKRSGPDFRAAWVSENIERIMGYPPSECLESPTWWQDHLHPDDRTTEIGRWSLLMANDRLVSEYRFLHKDGRYRWVRDERRLLRDRDGQARECVGSWVDITDRRELEEQYRQAQKIDAIGQLAGGVAHDFNNLLSVIMGYGDFLAGTVAAEHREPVEEIQAAAHRAAALTRQLLTFSRRQTLAPVVLNVNDVLNQMMKMIHRLIGEDIIVSAGLDTALHLVKVDPNQLEQVILNLVVNARDAMPRGGKLMFETANLELDKPFAAAHPDMLAGSYVMLSVRDTGCGMDAATLGRIFEPFFTTKERGKGTGLGLATVYGIVKQSGGHIAVSSVPGQGTTFQVYLPQCSEPAAAGRPQTGDRSPTGGETILLTEDDAAVRTLARRALQSCGYKVLEAATPDDALRIARERSDAIHLLLTDMVMPVSDGRELARRLAESRPDLKVLYMSGYSEDTITRRVLIKPGTPLLTKPFTLGELARKVRETLDANG